MRLTMQVKKSIIAAIALRYQKKRKETTWAKNC
jgi:hypothetical protein